ncbi:hypothetical protein HY988_00190 [Candidatus Micrarchaeota archaeon]|nr:hypothetical protein [Candidatus Micrarchaeota archaeon]
MTKSPTPRDPPRPAPERTAAARSGVKSPLSDRVSILPGKIIESLKTLGRNWSDLVAQSIGLHALDKRGTRLFVTEGEKFVAYSTSDQEQLMLDVMRSFSTGGSLPLTPPEYGIAVYEQTNNSYLVLVDNGKTRKLILRTFLSSYLEPEQNGWGNVLEAIRSAEREAAKPENRGKIIISDLGSITIQG